MEDSLGDLRGGRGIWGEAVEQYALERPGSSAPEAYPRDGDILHITAWASCFIHAFVHPVHVCIPGSYSFASIHISIAVPNLMVDDFWNGMANLLETDFGYDIGTCLEICGTAVN